MRRHRAGFALTAALMVLATACGDPGDGGSDSETGEAAGEPVPIEDLIAAAEEEGEVTWYASMPVEAVEALASGFGEQYPDIAVNIQRQPTFELWERIRTEAAAGQHTADIFGYNGYGILSDAIDEGIITQYVPEDVKETFDPLFVNEDDYSFGIRVTCMGIVYNTDAVEAADAPTSWADLADESWAGGKIASGDPAEQVLVLDFYWHMLQVDAIGQDFFDALGSSEPKLYTQGGQLVNALVAGEVPIGITWDYAGYTAALDGAPVEVVYPEEGVPCAGDENSVLAEAPHPNAARLLMTYLGTAEAGTILAETMGVYPAHPEGQALPEGRPALADLDLLPREAARQVEEQDAFNQMFDGTVR